MSCNAPYRPRLVAHIKDVGVHEYAQRSLNAVILQLRHHREDLLDILTQQRERGVQDFDSETINRMRQAEFSRARSAYGLPVRPPKVSTGT